MKLLRAIYNAFYWVRALQLAAKDDYASALCALERSSRQDCEYWTLKAFLQFALGDDDSFYQSYAICKEKRERSKLSVADKNYIEAYLDDLAGKVSGSNSIAPPDVSAVKLDSVSKHLKQNFPLKEHPCWKNV